MPRYVRCLFGIAIAVLVIGVPIGYARYREKHFRNFRVVQDRVLYRSGQMSLSALKRIIHDYEIKTVITLRDASILGEPPPDQIEEQHCRKEELNYYRIPPRRWWAPDGTVPADQGVRQFLEIMDDPKNYPVLIHCFAGAHRTGAFCAVYRMEYQHWTNADAIQEVKDFGYSNLDDEWDILTYLEEYRARWRQKNLPGQALPSQAPASR